MVKFYLYTIYKLTADSTVLDIPEYPWHYIHYISPNILIWHQFSLYLWIIYSNATIYL